MTNNEFSALSAEEQEAYFLSLTPEEVEGLTKAQAAAYQEWKAEQSDAPTEKSDAVAEYLKANPGYAYDEIILTSDGVFFNGSPKGKNAAINYCGQINTFKTFKI